MPIVGTFGNASARLYGILASRRRGLGGPITVTYLVVAGGGGSEAPDIGSSGGGGAGGFLTGTFTTSGGARLDIKVGAGGTGSSQGQASNITSTEGVFSGSTIEAIGGGAGSKALFPATTGNDGYPGGSGGGGGSRLTNQRAGGSGTPGQGFNGGAGKAYNFSEWEGGGGGGGAGGAGADAQGVFDPDPRGIRGGNGGSNLSSAITGSIVYYAGGGGGSGGDTTPGAVNENGVGSAPGTSGRSGNGGLYGGGAGGTRQGAAVNRSGGAGVVILRSNARASNTIGSPTEIQVSSDWVYRFTGSGSIILGIPLPE
jgi:hypothetical protein